MDQAYLKSILHYDPETGQFTWLQSLSQGTKAGSIAGYLRLGYNTITIKNKLYPAHRLAWLYVTGAWPEQEIDHIDRNRSNNQWINLREATHTQNLRNTGKYRNNKIGFKGVSRYRGKFRAQIVISGKWTGLGIRNSPEEAYELYKKAALEYFGEFARF